MPRLVDSHSYLLFRIRLIEKRFKGVHDVFASTESDERWRWELLAIIPAMEYDDK
jgi:hypothetical protein